MALWELGNTGSFKTQAYDLTCITTTHCKECLLTSHPWKPTKPCFLQEFECLWVCSDSECRQRHVRNAVWQCGSTPCNNDQLKIQQCGNNGGGLKNVCRRSGIFVKCHILVTRSAVWTISQYSNTDVVIWNRWYYWHPSGGCVSSVILHFRGVVTQVRSIQKLTV